ncbi:sugar phosphate isomerase/epimerase family protein [Bacillus cereus]
MKAKLTINLDEISSNIDVSFAFLKEMDLHTAELRMINEKNISLLNKSEVIKLSNKLTSNAITPIAIASPIFKWHFNNYQENVVHDNFGIAATLLYIEKENIIDSVLECADMLSIDKIRIFSYLGKVDNPFSILFTDRLFEKLIRSKHTFLIENEPVCTVYTKKHLEHLAELIARKNITSIKIWLDIANLIRIGEDIDEVFIEKIAPHIEYIHIKDFVYIGESIKYVPVGTGVIDYVKIITLLDGYIPNSQDITISIETHAGTEKEKYSFSKKSIMALREKLKEVSYES